MENGGGVALRVSQLDAAELDSEVISLTKAQLERLFKYHQNNLLVRFDPEIIAALKLLIWKYSVDTADATLGQQTLNLKYLNERAQGVSKATAPWQLITGRQKILYAILLIGCPWLKDRSCDIVKFFRLSKWKEKIDKVLHWTETGLKIASLINFLVFLRQGVYLSIVERLLGIRSVFPQRQGIRQVTFEYMTRELLWHGFSEFLFFILPLINFQRIRNFLVSKVLPKSVSQRGTEDTTQRDLTKCAICEEWPINAQEIGCQHVFCYFCLQSNFKADPSFSCPLCGQSVGDQSNIQRIKIQTPQDTDR